MYQPRDVSALRIKARYVPRGWGLFNPDVAMGELANQITWEEHDVNRKEAFFKRSNIDYRYGPGRPVRPYYPQEEPPILKQVWFEAENYLGHKAEALFINYYLNNEGNIGWHSDNSPTMNHELPLTLLSLGTTRVLCIRPIGETDFLETVMMEAGSLLIMEGGQQYAYEHASPRSLNQGGARMSLVFRPLVA